MIAIIVVYGVVGVCIASFLWYLANTDHGSKQLIHARSSCDHCHKTLKRYELIPVFSWLFQKGKCRNCQTKLSTDYLISEILTGILFVFVGSQIWSSTLEIQIIVIFLVSCLVYMAMIDIKKKELSLSAYGFALLLSLGLYFLTQMTDSIQIMYTTLYWFGLWFIIRLLGVFIHKLKYKEWGQGLGFGDVLFAGLLGLLFGLGINFTIWQEVIKGSNDVYMFNFFISLTLSLHMLLSSICGILGFVVLRDEKLAFIPYMLSGFVIMTIVLLYFSDYFLSFLAF